MVFKFFKNASENPRNIESLVLEPVNPQSSKIPQHFHVHPEMNINQRKLKASQGPLEQKMEKQETCFIKLLA